MNNSGSVSLMRKLVHLFILVFLYLILAFAFSEVQGQQTLEYVWPTDASKHLTSAFGEYRSRRFHAGIDIKTWGRVGYKVFATRPGYVWRISVSPYGYGKAIYLKLDTGEIAVYAHLSKFSEKIQKIVEAEQQRLGKYRINKYLQPGVLPVFQGEVIAYTGQTGIGAPHLHFEIRNSGNRPINPLLKGYQIPDHVNPIVKAVSISPLDALSEVNGDFQPVIVSPEAVGRGKYILKEPVTIWGNVGLAISCYDKGSSLLNGYGVYSLKLYIDDNLRFQYKYDKLSFKHNPMVQWERDYRLLRRRLGLFYKLYKEKHNTLTHYIPNKPYAGVFKSVVLDAYPAFQSKANLWKSARDDKANIKSKYTASKELDSQSGSLFPGLHEFNIEVADYFGNVSTVNGQLQVGATFNIQPVISEDSAGTIILNDILTYKLKTIEEVEVFLLTGNRWLPMAFEWTDNWTEIGGESPLAEFETWARGITLNNRSMNSSVLKFIARDQFGTPSYPFFYIPPTNKRFNDLPEVNVRRDFYDDYLRLEISSNSILREVPEVVSNPGRYDSMVVKIYQKDLNHYIGRIELDAISDQVHILNITTKNLAGEEVTVREQFNITKIPPLKTRRLISEDHNCRINFWLKSLYKPIYGRISIDTLSVRWDNDIVGEIYEVEPGDVPLKAGAIVHLRYPQDELIPEKLGVYYQKKAGKWEFIDNNINPESRTIWAKVFSLERFTLIRDEIPPEITQILPGNKQSIKTQTPRISAHVRDSLSGISSENEVVIHLDGRKLIAEYDPERHRIFYQTKQPLSQGRHEITVWAQDNSKNEALRKVEFWIE